MPEKEYDPRSASLRAIRSTYRKRVAGRRWGGIPPHDGKARGDSSGSKQDAQAARAHPKSMIPPDHKAPKRSSSLPATKGGSPRRSREGGMSYASRTEKYAGDGIKTSRKAATRGRFRSFHELVKATVTSRRPLKRKALPKSSKPPGGAYS